MNSKTKQVGLIGWPIAHSLSPAMQNAAFTELGLDWAYILLPKQPGELEPLLKNLAVQNIVGANVTMPHKQTIIPYLDQLRAYPNNPAARKAMRAQAKCRKAR
jgi:shikimate dehydrogenase